MLKKEVANRVSVIFLLAGLIFALGMVNTAEARGIRVLVNGQALAADVQPLLVRERVLVPLRVIAEHLGADLKWDGHTRTVTVTRGATNVQLSINADTARKNGTTIRLDAPARLVAGRTLVPLRFVGEVLGAGVQWDAAGRTVSVSVKPKWSVTIVAASGATVEFTDLDAAKMTPVTLDVEMRGRGGAVTRDTWTGVPLKDILAKKGITGYTGSTMEGADGFKAEYTREVMARPETIIAWLRNGQPMKSMAQEGDGPVRIVPKGEAGRMFVRNLVKITLHF